MKYLLFTVISLLSTQALANPVSIVIIPGYNGCKGAIIHNLSRKNLSITVNYTYIGVDSYGNQTSYSSTFGTPGVSQGARSAGDNYQFTYGLAAGQTSENKWLPSGPVSCDKPYQVQTSYTFRDLDAQNAQTQRAIDFEEEQQRQASNALFDQLAQREREKAEQRRKEYEEDQRRRDLRANENRRKAEAAAADPCLQLGQYCNRGANGIKASPSSMQNNSSSNSGSDEQMRSRREIADFAQRQAQEEREQAERQRIHDYNQELARGNAEREAYNRAAQQRAEQQQRDYQRQIESAQKAAEQRAAEEQRQRIAEERRQQEWQQSVNLTGALLQSSIQSGENALAKSQAKVGQIVNSYAEEDDALAAIIKQAKAAAGRK